MFRKYVVKPGDTLTQIAERLYGDWSKWGRLLDGNYETIVNDPRNAAALRQFGGRAEDWIFAGQVLEY